MDPQLFQRFGEIAYSKAGIKLHDGKEALVAARVAKRLRALGLSSPKEYLKMLESDPHGSEIILFLDAISTNFTSFFREAAHFDYLREFLTQKRRDRRKRLRVWCAASSSGEEPYTLAMTLAEALGESAVDWRILATDISTRILDVAERGEYDHSSVQNVPRALLLKYFSPEGPRDSEQRRWRVNDELRQRVLFKRLNLAKPPYPMTGPLDVVFCRNVMIYFDAPVRQGLVAEIDRLIADDGLVCIGHSESLNGLGTRLVAIEPSIYHPRNSLTEGCLSRQPKQVKR